MEIVTIGHIVARLRDSIKEQSDDSRYTNRYLWSTFYTFAKQLIKQDADKGKIYNDTNIWNPLCIEMEPVSGLYCNCIAIPYDCTVYRSKHKLPNLLLSSSGPIYRFISTPDMSRIFVLTTPFEYIVKSKIKYNNTRYAFIYDNYLYTPSDTYPLIAFSGLFDGPVDDFICNESDTSSSTEGDCRTKLAEKVQVPDYLIDAGIKMALSEILPSTQLVADEITNTNNLRINAQ